MTSPTIAAAIVAGGQARRFGGRDKSRLVIGGHSIIVRQLEVLRRITDRVIVVANDADRFADLDVSVHADVIPGAGAIGGVLTGVTHGHADIVIVVACDLPFLDDRVLRRLAELADGADGAWVQTARGVEPLLACYQARAADRIRGEIDAGRLRAADLGGVLHMAVLDEVELARFGPIERLLANVNSPDDYARVQ